MTDRFKSVFKKLMDLEGWDTVTDDPDDPGGLTKYGISKKSYPDLYIRGLTIDDAMNLYYKDFWQTVGFHRIHDKGLATKIFCTGVVMGPYPATRHLQNACNILGGGLKVDGVFGPISAAWVNDYRHPDAIESAFEVYAGQYVFDLKKEKYIAGWLIRIDKDMT